MVSMLFLLRAWAFLHVDRTLIYRHIMTYIIFQHILLYFTMCNSTIFVEGCDGGAKCTRACAAAKNGSRSIPVVRTRGKMEPGERQWTCMAWTAFLYNPVALRFQN